MMKLTYTETGFYLEKLTVSLEEFVTNRMLLSLRSGFPIHLAHSNASFLLPASADHLLLLDSVIGHDDSDTISLEKVDRNYVEIGFSGTWIASNPDAEEGTLVVVLSDRAEFYLYKIWQQSQPIFAFSA